MVIARVRTKLLLSLLLVLLGFSCASLLIVKSVMQKQISSSLESDLQNSIEVFKNTQRQREAALVSSVRLVADLPNVRALMTTHDALTIEDGSREISRLSGTDLFVLANKRGEIVAVHSMRASLSAAMLQSLFDQFGRIATATSYFYAGGHLYEIASHPIYFGTPEESDQLGTLALGYEVEDRLAGEVSQVAAGRVAFFVGNEVVAATLSAGEAGQLTAQAARLSPEQFEAIQLQGEKYLATSVPLQPSTGLPVRLVVLKSYDKAGRTLAELNRLLIVLLLIALTIGGTVAFSVSRSLTTPLEGLVRGVDALEGGDFKYPLHARGGDEIAELTRAFGRMRDSLRIAQGELLEAERMAVIGRMASSISHDLRHQLSAIFANAEFLSSPSLDSKQRNDLFAEVRLAVNEMTDLIDALLEFSRTRESLHPTFASTAQLVAHTIKRAQANPEFDRVQLRFSPQAAFDCWFDTKKLERAVYNILMNACQAVAHGAERGAVDLQMQSAGEEILLTIADNGCGVPAEIAATLFDPFVSSGKENGTGLGLTIAQKIIQEHGGRLALLRSKPGETVFQITLPRATEQPWVSPGSGLFAAEQRSDATRT